MRPPLSVVSLKRFVEPRSSGDFFGGKLPLVLLVDPPLRPVCETRCEYAFPPQRSEATDCIDHCYCRWCDLANCDLGLGNPLLALLVH